MRLRGVNLQRREWIHGWLLVLPALVFLFAFTHIPAIATFINSFHSTPRGRRAARFVGDANYERLLDDPVFWKVLFNNLWFALGTIPASIALAIVMALWVNDRLAGRGFVRMAYFTPTVLPLIAVANIWLFFYTPGFGLFDQISGGLFGWPDTNRLGDPDTALNAVIVVTVWKEAGFFMIFYLAALPAHHLPAAYADHAVRIGQRGDQFVPAGGSHLHPDRRWPGQRVLAAVVLHLRNGLQVLGYGLRGDANGDPAGAAVCAGDRPVLPVRPAGALQMTGRRFDIDRALNTAGAWVLALLWVLPLAYAIWTAIHPAAYEARFDLSAPLTVENFISAWNAAPFARYFLNTFVLVTMILAGQFLLCTLAAYAFARFRFPGRPVLFALVLLQLLVMPDILIVENYRTMRLLDLVDTIPAIALPYVASGFGIFLLRQTFMTVPRELDEAARVEGASFLVILWRVYIPLARPTYLAYGLVSVSHHWNNFLWPLIVTNSVETRPVTVGLSVFSAIDSGIEWSIINAATLMTSGPLLIAFLLFQRQFVQSFMRAGIK